MSQARRRYSRITGSREGAAARAGIFLAFRPDTKNGFFLFIRQCPSLVAGPRSTSLSSFVKARAKVRSEAGDIREAEADRRHSDGYGPAA